MCQTSWLQSEATKIFNALGQHDVTDINVWIACKMWKMESLGKIERTLAAILWPFTSKTMLRKKAKSLPQPYIILLPIHLFIHLWFQSTDYGLCSFSFLDRLISLIFPFLLSLILFPSSLPFLLTHQESRIEFPTSFCHVWILDL